MHRATFAIPCTDSASAAVLVEAVGVETDDGPGGTETSLVLDGLLLNVSITAVDLAGLRAAIHSTLRLLDAAIRTMGV
jgi:tRNA threonylcarbamoyladenosine modification (KEOPS) complex  Pcc1 subunit